MKGRRDAVTGSCCPPLPLSVSTSGSGPGQGCLSWEISGRQRVVGRCAVTASFGLRGRCEQALLCPGCRALCCEDSCSGQKVKDWFAMSLGMSESQFPSWGRAPVIGRCFHICWSCQGDPRAAAQSARCGLGPQNTSAWLGVPHFFLKSIYLFGCAESQLQHEGS